MDVARLPAIGHGQNGADGNPERLSIERVATALVEQHRIGPEDRRVAEHGTHIVVVGNAATDKHERLLRQAVEKRTQFAFRLPPAKRQNTAMQMEADDAVEHL